MCDFARDNAVSLRNRENTRISVFSEFILYLTERLADSRFLFNGVCSEVLLVGKRFSLKCMTSVNDLKVENYNDMYKKISDGFCEGTIVLSVLFEEKFLSIVRKCRNFVG